MTQYITIAWPIRELNPARTFYKNAALTTELIGHHHTSPRPQSPPHQINHITTMRKNIIRHRRITFKPLRTHNNGLNTPFTTHPITPDKITSITLIKHGQTLSRSTINSIPQTYRTRNVKHAIVKYIPKPVCVNAIDKPSFD